MVVVVELINKYHLRAKVYVYVHNHRPMTVSEVLEVLMAIDSEILDVRWNMQEALVNQAIDGTPWRI